MTLNQPYYIEPRKGEAHLELDGSWEFFGSENARNTFENRDFLYRASLPRSVFRCLHEAGVLPDPYIGTNSRLYADVDEKIWYFRKTFTLDRAGFDGTAVLCFDGVAYYCRVCLNGTWLGDHEGMFGGPCADVTELLRYNGENELIVEVKSCQYGKKNGYNERNNGENPEIQPWNTIRDALTSNGDFIVLGIWNRVRIEFLAKTHLSRPALTTESCSETEARLRLSCELIDGTVPELRPFSGYNDPGCAATFCHTNGLTGKKTDVSVTVGVTITEKDTGVPVYENNEVVPLKDHMGSLSDPAFFEQQFYEADIILKCPKLWYPVGLGTPFLYDVRLELKTSDGVLLDVLEFDTGIRIIKTDHTAAERSHTRQGKFLFSVNGRRFFLKGINWMPIDFLYGIDPKEYEWCVRLAKNAGIQMLRVWSGGGMPETDVFYSLCDRYGILVWQDHMIANTADTHRYPQDVLEAEEAYNLYRTRTHPSLAVHCGGNEFAPYATGNASSLFIIDRVIRALDPSRVFYYTTPVGGSAHVYRDMEPVWYRKAYGELPFLAESGIHSFPSFKTLKRVLSEKECTGILNNLLDASFRDTNPELLNHFTEYEPARVPRMLARASQIGDIKNMTLEKMCEATQLQAVEWYTLMIQAMRDNYPRCGGVMPWVFKRHWPTVGIQVVDGLGQPTYPYYAVQNACRPIGICLRQEWSVIAPNEPIPLEIRLFNDTALDLDGADISVYVFSPDLTADEKYTARVHGGQVVYPLGVFATPDEYTDRCFLLCADLSQNGVSLTRTVYFVKCTSQLADVDRYMKYRSSAAETLSFPNGPWLADELRNAGEGALNAECVGCGIDGGWRYFDIRLRCDYGVPVYPVILDAANPGVRTMATDNVFMMLPNEIKVVRVLCDGLTDGEAAEITISAFNAKTKRLKMYY